MEKIKAFVSAAKTWAVAHPILATAAVALVAGFIIAKVL